MAYPVSELSAALAAAHADGLELPPNMHPHDVVRVLERHRYLPRDRARVAALVESVTWSARMRVRDQRAAPEQLALPLWDRRGYGGQQQVQGRLF